MAFPASFAPSPSSIVQPDRPFLPPTSSTVRVPSPLIEDPGMLTDNCLFAETRDAFTPSDTLTLLVVPELGADDSSRCGVQAISPTRSVHEIELSETTTTYWHLIAAAISKVEECSKR